MKALQIIKYDEIKDRLAINEIEKPILKAKDVLIEVKALLITNWLKAI
jgi:NADPH:quinone reductase-like Zn-dependent oxidoreductase